MLEQRKNKLVEFYLIAVIILLIFFHYLGLLAFIERPIGFAFGQGQSNVYLFLTKLKYSFINYQEAKDLKIANESLKQQINQLTYENSQLQSYKLENEKLRALLNFKQGKDFNLVTANVIGKDSDKANTLIINRGSRDNIKAGEGAIINNGVIIGKVIEVKDSLSLVLLLTDKQSQLAVSTQNVEKACGLAEGEYGLSLNVSYIPQDLNVNPGDTFITSGTEAAIPRGLIVGQINRITSQPNELFKAATISLPADYNEITILSIIIPNQYQ